jgi:signal transduction histidine kinase
VTPAIVVQVRPYFWQTIWFWAGVAVASLGAVGLGVQAYDRRKTARQLLALEARHAVERERARIARDIHDDVGAGLTEVAMLSELAQDDGAHPHQLHEHLDSIFRRARQMTQSLDEIVWAINPANDTADSFISYIGEFAQDFLGAAGVACRLDLPRDPPPVSLGAHVRHHLWLAIKESLHNIVKHAGASEVQLEIKLQGRELSVSISDNGRGFVSGDVTSNGQDGLKNLRARLQEIDGDLQHESRPGSGTRLVLSVKLPTVARRRDQVS